MSSVVAGVEARDTGESCTLAKERSMYTQQICRDRRVALLAPRTGDLRSELALELAEYFGLSSDEVWRRLDHASDHFTSEWREKVRNPDDADAVIRFYNESTTEVFDLAEWHAVDEIHGRSIVAADILEASGATELLDYGAGIGSDALVFAKSGLKVTLADVATPLLQFARWRCERHGCTVDTIDLKQHQPGRCRYDAAVCFDVLEHIKRPRSAVRTIWHALRPDGLLFLHAPFGPDPDRPMHLAHTDSVSPRIRTLGFHWREDIEKTFPDWMWPPRVYQRFEVRSFERLGYYVQDVWMPGSATARLGRWYRQFVPRPEA